MFTTKVTITPQIRSTRQHHPYQHLRMPHCLTNRRTSRCRARPYELPNRRAKPPLPQSVLHQHAGAAFARMSCQTDMRSPPSSGPVYINTPGPCLPARATQQTRAGRHPCDPVYSTNDGAKKYQVLSILCIFQYMLIPPRTTTLACDIFIRRTIIHYKSGVISGIAR